MSLCICYILLIQKFKLRHIFLYSSGMTNCMFMPDGSLVIEIRPINWDVKCFERQINAMGW